MMQTADNVCWCFSNSPKRQLALEKWISQICSEKKRKCLKEMCRTRWVERHEAFEVFVPSNSKLFRGEGKQYTIRLE